MASYSTMSTIPAADVETEHPLLKRDVKLNVKTVLAGAAGAAFILGVDMVVLCKTSRRWRVERVVKRSRIVFAGRRVA